MRKTLIVGLCLCAINALAQPVSLPKWAKKARKSIVTIVTRDDSGAILGERTGFVIATDGRVLTTYDNLPGAACVEIKDANGKIWQAQRVLAADAMMDYCLLTTDIKKPVPIAIAATHGTEGDKVFVLGRETFAADSIVRVEMVGQQPYYSTSCEIVQACGCPLMNTDGEVLGLVHASNQKGSYAVSIGTTENNAGLGLSLMNKNYSALPIAVQLPDNEEQARTFIFLSQGADSTRYMTHVDDYIKRWPTLPFGYTSRGEFLIAHRDTVAAAETYMSGMKQVDAGTQHELLYSHSVALYRMAIQTNDNITLLRSLSLVDEAISQDAQPFYQNHRAMVLYALHRYSEAAAGFRQVATTNMRNAQTFVYASQSHRMAGDSIIQVLEMLDSAVACYPNPLPQEAANTVLLRATTRAEAGLWRPAVSDYNSYEHLCGGYVNSEFYFRRFIAEANGRLFQQALDDLDRAIALTPEESELYAQKALLLYRLGQTEEAKEPALKAIELDESWKDELKDMLGEQ